MDNLGMTLVVSSCLNMFQHMFKPRGSAMAKALQVTLRGLPGLPLYWQRRSAA